MKTVPFTVTIGAIISNKVQILVKQEDLHQPGVEPVFIAQGNLGDYVYTILLTDPPKYNMVPCISWSPKHRVMSFNRLSTYKPPTEDIRALITNIQQNLSLKYDWLEGYVNEVWRVHQSMQVLVAERFFP